MTVVGFVIAILLFPASHALHYYIREGHKEKMGWVQFYGFLIAVFCAIYVLLTEVL